MGSGFRRFSAALLARRQLSTLRAKASGIVVIILALQLCFVVACEKSARMEVSEDNPPVMKVSGDAYFDWLQVYGPLPERKDNKTPSLIWKLAPVGPPPPLNEVPSIVYGKVPQGFVQEHPKAGAPPALVEGGVYAIGVITRSPYHPHKTIIIRNGKAVEFRQE